VYQHALADGCQLVVPDLPGHGRSSPLATAFSIHDLAQCLSRLLRTLGLERPILLGYSQGASIALEYALCYPHNVRGLILAGAFSEVNELYLHSRFYLAETMASLHGVGILARSITSSHIEDPTVQEQWIEHASLTDAASLKQLYTAGHAYQCTHRLTEIDAPALLVYGEEDRQMHPYGQLLSAKLRQAELVFIPGVAHQVVTKAAPAFHLLCRDFLTKNKEG
jgi:pimeloyl-ACP methyl ester carboxylesterase